MPCDGRTIEKKPQLSVSQSKAKMFYFVTAYDAIIGLRKVVLIFLMIQLSQGNYNYY